MEKLRLNVDGLKVESFEASAEVGAQGTVAGFAASECSCQYTCGVASRGQEGYDAYPLTRYACCV